MISESPLLTAAAFLLQFPIRPHPMPEPRAAGLAATLKRVMRALPQTPDEEIRALGALRIEEDFKTFEPAAMRWILATAWHLLR